MNSKVAVFSLGEKGYRLIESIIHSAYKEQLECVVIGTDKNVLNDFSEELTALCKKENITFTDRHSVGQLKATNWFAVGWRWIIHHEEMVKLIVFHESLLPKYRGFAPLVNQLINGEKTIGVTAIVASEEFDRGPVVFQEKINLQYPVKIQEAIELVTPVYCNIALKIIQTIAEGNVLKTHKQDEAMASYSVWRDEEDYMIDWNWSSDVIERSVNALGHPYTGANCRLNNKLITIKEVQIVDDVKVENRDVGKVLFFKDEFPIVICKSGMVKITEAYYKESGKSIFPLEKYRSRFS